MQCISLIPILATLLTQAATAASHDYSQYAGYSLAQWEEMRQEVCGREFGHSAERKTNCDNLINAPDNWVNPKNRYVNLLSTLAPEIKATAKLYDIDPRALVGAILAEDTINDDPADRLQQFLVQTKITPTGTIGG